MQVLLPLFWIFLLAFLIQMISAKLRLPSIIGYVLMGIWLGNSGWSLFAEGSIAWLDSISQFGLYFLMFLSGMEIDIRLLRPSAATGQQAVSPLRTGLILFLATCLLAYAAASVMHSINPAITPWMMMLVLCTTSLGIVLPVLREHQLLRTPFGQNLLTAALLADLLSLLALSLASDYARNGLSWHELSVGLLLPLFAICYLGLTRFQRTRWWRRWFQSDSQAKLQGLLALLGIFGVVTDFTGNEPILGSFLAGLLLACFRLHDHHPFRKQLELLGYGFIIPLFFVMVGTHFSVQEFLNAEQSLQWVVCLLITAFAVKILPMLWFGRTRDLRSAWAGGLLLSSRMTLIIVASSIGVSLGLIPTDVQRATLVVSILTCLASPILFTLVYRRAEP